MFCTYYTNISKNKKESLAQIQPRRKVEAETRIIIEEIPDNYGHKKLIWVGDIKFPDRSTNDSKREYITDTSYSDKGRNIDVAYDNGLFSTTTDFFKLYRYGIDDLRPPNDNDGPTLVMSLFMPNTILHHESNIDFSD